MVSIALLVRVAEESGVARNIVPRLKLQFALSVLRARPPTPRTPLEGYLGNVLSGAADKGLAP